MRCVSVETLRWLTMFLSNCSDVRPSGWPDFNNYYYCFFVVFLFDVAFTILLGISVERINCLFECL